MTESNMSAKGPASARLVRSQAETSGSASGGKKLILAQFIILLAGTLFAWTNFTIELVDWLNKRACSTGCVVGIVNPFLTPCFYGAIFFTLAFVFSVLILKKNK